MDTDIVSGSAVLAPADRWKRLRHTLLHGVFPLICITTMKRGTPMDHGTLAEDVARLKKSFRTLSTSPAAMRNNLLLCIAQGLEADKASLFEANRADMASAQAAGEKTPLLKRLKFDEDKLSGVCEGLRQISRLDDPINAVLQRRLLDDGFLLEQVTFPIGVIGMIFESRPDALVQIISLCLKSGNGIILKGGKEAVRTNRALVASIRRSCEGSPLGSDWLILLESHEDVNTMLSMDKDIDLLIPRGSNAFVRYVMDHTKIPVLGHADGICAMYIDKAADLDMAVKCAVDSKIQYPAACNALETLLVHADIAQALLPRLSEAMSANGVTLKGDDRTRRYIACEAATEEDFHTEFLALTLAVKVVDSYDDAVEHIAAHSSHHTDCVITEDVHTARRFLRDVDSADVFWNCSTRFSDGFRFGLGAEVGISTGKIHARGPVGLAGLMSSKWLLRGHGETVAEYSGSDAKKYLHEELPTDGVSLAGAFEE